MLDVGPHGIIPANCPPFPQHALLAVTNPAFLLTTYYNHEFDIAVYPKMLASLLKERIP